MNNRKYIMSFTSMGDYRLEVMKRISENLNNKLTIYAGDQAFDPSIRLINNNDMFYKRIKNVFLLQRKFLYQFIPFREYLACDVLLLDLNPRIINVWLLVILRRFLGKPVVVWGHAFPRGGAKSKSDMVRGLLRKLSKNVIVYTESQSKELKEISPFLNVVAAPNALYSKSQMCFVNNAQREDILYVGRLVKEKTKILLKGFIKACEIISFEARLIFVGDGSEKKSLENIVSTLPVEIRSRIFFLGHVAGHEKISKLYSSTFVSVSPGYVGLSITQSFSFGVPMIISKDEPHAPEIEAAIEGENSAFFSTDEIDSLSTQLLGFYNDRRRWVTKGNQIVHSCQRLYSVEVMADRICSALVEI
ncbi:hypothetical protein C427_1052 [Paraglaciecola psychrophila 170]|uniref:Glycosyl transferase family 1 domain-containing protein n=1 Tax=Paraglaciecola psychrophila 170 TaxID=1129794 RepID=M4RHV2_9ALTE|nr:glycosyltransferase [Paraglaciecola psychrophila]AGH43161.1 hypothetical protein C427_1052 [Paraglaciecola psychrophila 170]